jgi:hypothetical protein
MGGIVDAVVSVVSSFISWLIPIPKVPDFDTNAETEKGVLINKSSNNAQIPVVYGERQVGITRVFLETSGSDNEYLYMAGVLCEGEIQSIEEVYIDDKLVTFASALTHGSVVEVGSGDANFYKDSTSHIQVQSFLGLDNQVSSSILSTSTNWGANHRLRGVAYLALRFKWNQDIFGQIPQVKVTLKGRKVYDPRTTTTAYSSNPALCLLDYLRSSRYGKGLPDSAFEANFQSFQDSADECETQVTPYTGGTDINVFDTNAVLDSSQKIIDNVKKLLNPMRALFTYTEGVYKLKIESTGSPVKTITADYVVGGAKVLGERKNNKYNRVIGTFVNPEKNWQQDTISFPPADDSALPLADQHATMLALDNGTLLEGNFDFPNVTSPYQAEDLCEIILRRSRNQLQIQLRLTSEFLDLAIGDVVGITYPSGGFNNKPFRVLGMTINEDLTVDVQLFEHQDNFYTWTSKAQAPTIADTSLPNPYNVQPPASVTLSDQLIAYNDGTVIVALDILIGASPDSFVDYYQVEYKKQSETDYQIHGQGTGLNQRVLNVIDQEVYDVRVKAVNSIGASSTYVSATRTIVGAIAPPSDVQDFSCNIVGNTAHLAWSPVPDLDLAYYAINYSTLTTGASWNNSFPLVSKVSRPATSVSVPARTGSFLIKAVDKLGNFSSNETIITTNIDVIGNFNAIVTQSEEPTFTGVKTNIVLIEQGLTLDTLEQFDDNTTDDFDDITTRLFDSGTQASNLYTSGNYVFSNIIDIGGIYTSRVTASITQSSTDTDRIFDFVSGDFDLQPSNFDGDSSVQSNSHLEISLSDDNVTYTPFRNFNVGDYRARYYKFRLFMTSSNGSATPIVSALSVTVDMPDRIFSGNDIESGTGTKTVTFTVPFFNPNYALSITAESLATGDFFEISNRTINGFDVAFKNSSGTGVSKQFDYLAKGY